MKNPKVTVLMTVCNGGKYLAETLGCVMAQTFRDFEMLIIDDGSTDQTVEIIQSFADARIRLLRNQTNLGIYHSRNLGMEEARGEYICLLDHDDLCTPNRLEVQVKFMDAHPDIGLSGSFADEVDADGKIINGRIRSYPTQPDEVVGRLWSGYTILNPTVILRRNDFVRHGIWHDTTFKVAGDYDFYVKAARKLKLANIPQVLLHYRQHPNQASITNELKLSRALLAVQLEIFRELFPAWPEARFEVHRRLSRRECDYSSAEVQSVAHYFTAIAEENAKKAVFFDGADLKSYVQVFWSMYLRHITHHSPQTFLNLRRSPYFDLLRKRRKLKLLAKSLVFWHEKPDTIRQ